MLCQCTSTVPKAKTKKYSRNNLEYSLEAFAKDTFRHMQNAGMDSMFYMLGMLNATSCLSIIQNQIKFMPDYVTNKIKLMGDAAALTRHLAEVANNQNNYDKENLDASCKWIMNSLDKSVLTLIQPYITADMSGPEV